MELDTQILSASLRQSWAEGDATGLQNARAELSMMYPDLAAKGDATLEQSYYELLEISCDANPNMIRSAYYKALKTFLRQNTNTRSAESEFTRILNAGFILTKKRLRLSHDLVATQKAINEAGLATQARASAATKTDTTRISIPLLLEMLFVAKKISMDEVQAIVHQSFQYPDIAVAELILQAEYLTEEELHSIELAHRLVQSGNLSMEQFKASLA